MSASDASPARTSFQVGPDLVTTEDKFVRIDAVREFPEWQVRGHARIPIYFQEQRYFLREKQAGSAPFGVRYILELWPMDHVTAAPFSFEYNAETVAQRDADHTEGRRNETVGKLLYVFYPFLGLLWSDTKDKLIRFGFVPRSLTSVSIGMMFFVMLMEAIFAGRLQLGLCRLFIDRQTFYVVGMEIPVLFLDFFLVGLLLLDCVMRYDAFLRESPIEWGFFEWVKKLFLRKKKQSSAGGKQTSHEGLASWETCATREVSPPDHGSSGRKVA